MRDFDPTAVRVTAADTIHDNLSRVTSVRAHVARVTDLVDQLEAAVANVRREV